MITKKGLVLGLAAPLFIVAGLWSGRTGLTGLGVALAAYVAVGRMLAPAGGLTGTLATSQETVREDDPWTATATLTASGRRTGLVEVHVALPPVTNVREGEPFTLTALSAGRDETLSFEADVPVRGIYPVGPLEVRARDPFSLFSREWQLAPSKSLTVYPRWRLVKDLAIKGKLPRMLAGQYIVHQPGDGTEFFGLRDYLPGDAMRLVNWKASAKAGGGDLVVNQWERESVTEATIFLDTREVTGLGTQVENPLLHETRLCATLASYFMGLRDSVRVVVYGETVRSHRGGRGEGHFHNILQDLSTVQPSGTTHLGHAVDESLARIPPKSPVIILTPALGDPSLGDALARLMAQGNTVIVLVPRIHTPDTPGGRALQEAFDEAVDRARSVAGRVHVVHHQDEALQLINEVVF